MLDESDSNLLFAFEYNKIFTRIKGYTKK